MTNINHEIAKLQEYDLWLFLEPDVEWVNDGLRVHGEESARGKNNHDLRKLLDRQNIDYKILSGNYESRLNSAIKSIGRLLQ